MTQTALRPATLCRDEQAETSDFAAEQIGSLNNKAAQNLQGVSINSYSVDAQLNVIHLQFSPVAKWESLL